MYRCIHTNVKAKQNKQNNWYEAVFHERQTVKIQYAGVDN